ncbi:recombinase family protein [Feifania hominis]|uniref:Uncharacterized protein n=1 Tax=Feifania hominis TaxID=2763660 RepID=A0A926HUG6_9FIRM|nr:recombinase family protein [Feifania hominis]MBC8535925.1 hypothetical protein [Feifania hominis]
MTFYEQELRKIVEPVYPDAAYAGRACYVRLDEMNRAKLQFITGQMSNQYDRILVTILNRNEGTVDKLSLLFSDLLGIKQTDNPNFRSGVSPHIWDDYNHFSYMQKALRAAAPAIRHLEHTPIISKETWEAAQEKKEHAPEQHGHGMKFK